MIQPTNCKMFYPRLLCIKQENVFHQNFQCDYILVLKVLLLFKYFYSKLMMGGDF